MISLGIEHKATPTQVAKWLEDLDLFLSENEQKIFECTCEDHDPPRGSMDYEVNAYTHHDDCPSGMADHYHIVLSGLAQYFKEVQQC